MKEGITRQGEFSTDKFCEITGFKKPSNKSDSRGDAFYNDVWVEIKKNSLNQTRPYRYLPIIVHNDRTDEWFVIPPHEVISSFLFNKQKLKKGQHTPNPMTCIGLGEISNKKFSKYKTTAESLFDGVLSAFQAGENNIKYKNFAKKYEKKLEDDCLATEKELINLHNEEGDCE